MVALLFTSLYTRYLDKDNYLCYYRISKLDYRDKCRMILNINKGSVQWQYFGEIKDIIQLITF